MFNMLIKWFLVVIIMCVIAVLARTEPVILGADISWIQQKEAAGVSYADNGVEKDILEILKDHGFNWIRLRLFVDPTAKISGESESPYSADGFCNLKNTLIMAKRVKNAGMKILLDFHYSDTWADPAKQHKPVSWEGLSFAQLTDKVRLYTKQTLESFKSDDVLPDMVQVGNEIVGGMIWPDGKISNMSNFAKLLNAGIDGVKEVDSNIQIMIHSISKNSPGNWLKNLINAGVNRIDVFGLSYYSQYHGTPDDLQKMVNEIAANNKIKIVIAEYADNHQRVNDIIFNLPQEQGIGTFVWEPADWNETLFDWKNGRRETNNRIDLYPQMSKDYGNDDIVRINKPDYNFRIVKENKKCSLRLNSNGFLKYNGIDDDRVAISMITFDGTLIRQWNNINPGMCKLNVNDRSTLSPVQSGRYFLIVENQKNKKKMYITSFCR